PELQAMLPPIDDIWELAGSGGYMRPCRAASSWIRPVIAPAPAMAQTLPVSISMPLMRSSDRTMPPPSGTEPPTRLDPPPRATTGMPCRLQTCITPETSAVLPGSTAAMSSPSMKVASWANVSSASVITYRSPTTAANSRRAITYRAVIPPSITNAPRRPSMDTWLAWGPRSGEGSRPAGGFLSCRCGRILAKQALVFELGPEVLGDRHVEPPQVLLELVYRPDSEEDSANARMSKRELKGCRRQRYTMPIAHRLNTLRASQDGRLSGNVVVPRARRGVDKDAAVEHTSDHDRDCPLLTQRQELVHRHLVEQRVPACDQEDIQVARLDKPDEHRRLVHTRADGPRRPVPPQLGERPVPGRAGCVEMFVGIVEEQDVKPVEPGPLEALFDRPHDAVVGEIPDGSDRRNVLVERFSQVELAFVARRIGPEETADLRGHEDLVARELGHRTAHALLGESVA